MGFNLRNRYDVLEAVQSSKEDISAPRGVKQGIFTLGNYVLLFVAGRAYYRLSTLTGWTPIAGFSMSTTAPRVWIVTVPVSTTNYARIANTSDLATPAIPDSRAGINALNVSATFAGNNPGVLVQDGVNQPQFIFLDNTGNPTTRITQSYDEWSFPLDPTTLQLTGTDNREYVPIGTFMAWYNGILFIVAIDGQNIYRSVSGRPLDFVVNVDEDGQKGGDATTTSYSVGVGGITSLYPTAGGSLFVSAGGLANFDVTLNTANTAPTEFGEYTFLRSFLFNAGVMSDRAIVDVIGDTTFIDVGGLRSFNAVEQLQNEGRNDPFSATVQSLFTGIIQQPDACAAIVFDNYALYGVETVYGNAIIVYDTLNKDFCSVDLSQTGGAAVKQFAKIETDIVALYAMTGDDKIYQLYCDTTKSDTPIVRPRSITTNAMNGNQNVNMQTPKMEIKPTNYRVVLTNITKDCTLTGSVFMNNRLVVRPETKQITYVTPTTPYNLSPVFADADTQLVNALFSIPDCGQGYKTFVVLSWTGGKLTNWSMTGSDLSPMNPLLSQGKVV